MLGTRKNKKWGGTVKEESINNLDIELCKIKCNIIIDT